MTDLNEEIELLRKKKKQNHDLKICFDKIVEENVKSEVKEIIILSDKIYKEVAVNTEKIFIVKNYIRFYLSSVIKVVDRYVVFKEANISNKDAINLYEKIEEFLPKAKLGITRIFESLYSNEILDLDSEIKLMLKELGMK